MSEKYMINKRSTYIAKGEIFRDYRESCKEGLTATTLLLNCDFEADDDFIEFYKR